MIPEKAQNSDSGREHRLPALNVLMITGRADSGGGPEHVYQLSRAMAGAASVFIACPREEPYWNRYQSIVGPDRMLEIPHRRLSLGAFRSLSRFIRARGIDIVHSHGRTAGIYARPIALLAGLRCFHTPNGSKPVTGPITLLYAVVEYILSTITRGIIAVSGTERSALRPQCVFANRLEVIHNGVEIPPHTDSPDTRLAGPRRVIHVTRFVHQKNSGLLLEIIAAVRNLGELDTFEFLILGDGPGRAEFEAGLASLGLADRVKLLGTVSNPGDYLAAAFCLVSTSRWEGLPLALLEGMARGVPAIATAVTGNKDAVDDHETGFLYDSAEPRAAALHLVRLAHSPVLWKRMVRAARRRAEEQFSAQAMANATLRLYARPAGPEEEARAPFTTDPAPASSPAVSEVAGAVHISSGAICKVFPPPRDTQPA